MPPDAPRVVAVVTVALAGLSKPGLVVLQAVTLRGGFLEVPPLWKGVIESPRS